MGKDSDIISVNFPSESTEPTKRGILSKVAKISDPLGLVSLITLGGKFLYREYDAKLDWDTKLMSNLVQSWVHWEVKLPSQVTACTTIISGTSRRHPDHRVNMYLEMLVGKVWLLQYMCSISRERCQTRAIRKPISACINKSLASHFSPVCIRIRHFCYFMCCNSECTSSHSGHCLSRFTAFFNTFNPCSSPDPSPALSGFSGIKYLSVSAI